MNQKIKISDKVIGQNRPCFIIAEAGVNHNGKLSLAKKMVDVALWAGADAIKFQTFRAEALVTKDAPKADYQAKESPGTQFEMLKLLELSRSDFQVLFDHCKKRGIIFLSTPFDSGSAKLLFDLGVDAFKIGSGDLSNLPLIKQVALYGRPIFLSTGMGTLDDVKKAASVVRDAGNEELILLHCTTNYPTKYEDVNLRAMQTLKNEFSIEVGFSDHTVDDLSAITSIGLGAVVIEKHFTLDNKLPGPDHKASVQPRQLKDLIRKIRRAEKILGDGEKKPRKSEFDVSKIVKKSLFAARDIPEETVLTAEMIDIKRPEVGLVPENFDKIIGHKII